MKYPQVSDFSTHHSWRSSMVECTLLDQWCRTSSEEALVSQNYLRVTADQEKSHQHIRPPYRHQLHTRLQHLLLIFMFNLVRLLCNPALCPHRRPRVCFRQVSRSNNAKLVLGVVVEERFQPQIKVRKLLLSLISGLVLGLLQSQE